MTGMTADSEERILSARSRAHRSTAAPCQQERIHIVHRRRRRRDLVTQTIAINGRSYRLKDHATAAGKEDKSKKTKSKSNDTSAAEPAS